MSLDDPGRLKFVSPSHCVIHHQGHLGHRIIGFHGGHGWNRSLQSCKFNERHPQKDVLLRFWAANLDTIGDLPHEFLGQGCATFGIRDDPNVIWSGYEIPDPGGKVLEFFWHVHIHRSGFDHSSIVGCRVSVNLFPF